MPFLMLQFYDIIINERLIAILIRLLVMVPSKILLRLRNKKIKLNSWGLTDIFEKKEICRYGKIKLLWDNDTQEITQLLHQQNKITK